ncbi:dTDP-glucose 4,6 dehydratase, NAD(P)-binding [Desulfamplus magnetovallimortis]|uniref:dTDP-glucose 4,6-dehydratase n=1 Tax=Desulfamplus magnetovallimortis TaxID=1246637 RepID=A0A1W1HDU4_9BACT|nr:dTDP-glucose 4,6-dehydratase [Desulfamplus magnetovallimortis]SLM30545.1 dTDP-glucose 4,6 dehydratase, NAD(P)-binding [Desulfamplus magnetovallimortis]
MHNLMVTGGCGFIGSNFIRYLLDESSFTGRVVNVDKLTYAGNPESLSDIKDRHKERYFFEKADICNASIISMIFKKYEIDSVCHFAAESHVDRSIASPEVFIDTNVKGTFNLLECARKSGDGFNLFHHVSTDEVYGTLGKTGCFTEETPYAPNSPYSASKAASDHLVRAYHETYGLPVTISNCSNNYGPFQFPEKLVPLMILNAMERKPLPVYGDGSNIRDWLYVMDHCKAIWLVMEKGHKGRTYNIGGGCEMKNLEIVEKICDTVDLLRKRTKDTGSSRELITFVKDRPGHDFRYAIDSSRVRNELGWSPEESFETGSRKTIEWYFENMTWVDSIRSGEYLKWIETHYNV